VTSVVWWFVLTVSVPLLFFLSVLLFLRSTLFPYTTLFRSLAPRLRDGHPPLARLRHPAGHGGRAHSLSGARLPGELDQYRHGPRSEEHTSELQSRGHLVCRLLLEKKKQGYHLRSPTRLIN